MLERASSLSIVGDAGPLPYDLDDAFERLLVYHVVNDTAAWALLGVHLDPRCLRDARCRDLVTAAHTFHDRVGRGPGGARVVVQLLREHVAEGKQTERWVAEREELLDEVVDANDPLPSARDVVAAAAEIVRRRAVGDAVQELVRDFASRRDVGKSVQRIQTAGQVGLVTSDRGLRLGTAAFEAIDLLRYQEKLTVGIPEVDTATGGGLGRSMFGMYLAGTGGGKSLFLTSLAAAAVLQGRRVAYASLELPQAVVMARVIANLTGELIEDITSGHHGQAQLGLAALAAPGTLGTCDARDFPPLATTVAHIESWVEELEDESGEAIDLVIADSLDDARTGDNSLTTFEAMKLVYTAFRDNGRRRNRGGWTASQATREGLAARGGEVRLDLGHVSESVHKIHLPDFVLTGALSDDNSEVRTFIAKNRNGVARMEFGPFPTDLARGRLVPALHVFGKVP